MKKVMKDIIAILGIGLIFVAAFANLEIWTLDEKGTVTYTEARPLTTDGEWNGSEVGLREVTTSPYGLVVTMYDSYPDGSWAKSGVLFGHVLFDAYAGRVRWI